MKFFNCVLAINMAGVRFWYLFGRKNDKLCLLANWARAVGSIVAIAHDTWLEADSLSQMSS